MILAIETSCDDSAVALIGMDGKIISNEISSQVPLHERYGGVVPEIASRKHLTSLPLLIRYTLETHNLSLKDLTAVAVTSSPGLVGSLLVGVSYAKTLSWIAGVPLIPVDHLEGHMLAPFLDHDKISFPYLALIASGGHTHLIHAKKLGDYKLLGKTIDDASGEAYDKVAKMLGFQYPGGPIIDKLANDFSEPTIEFPIPLQGKKTLNFSFSGLKTAVRNVAIEQGVYVEKQRLIGYDEFMAWPDSEKKKKIMNIAASFQKIMVTIISKRFQQAFKETGLQQMAVTGGVACNSGIRAGLTDLARRHRKDFFYPSGKNCTDNAAMIGYTALQYLKEGKIDFHNDLRLNASSKSPINQLQVES